ncbi:MAG: PLDc N-terminal domain-containing protein [Candidatus Thermoplasmatota archaeon]|nr:PLDc N-terminal domain-containing protein [Candidatus Thermoplasmatota archaeon]
MSVQMYVFIGLFVLLLLLLLLIWSLFIFTIIHCLLTEKDHTKKIFWLFAILIAGGVGSLLYLFLRLPRRRREAREPGYRSEFEEKILRAISRRKVPSRKALLRKRRSRRAMFAVMHTVFVSFIIGVLLGILMAVLTLGGSNLEPLILLAFLLMFLGGAILLYDPRRGWSEFLVIGTDKEDLTSELQRIGYHWNEGRLFFEVRQGRGIHVHLIDDYELIKEKMEMSDIKKKKGEATLLLAFFAMRSWGDPMRLMSRGMFGIKSYGHDARSTLLEHLGGLERGPIHELTFKESGLVNEGARMTSKGK